jgi:hypothetical protein
VAFYDNDSRKIGGVRVDKKFHVRGIVDEMCARIFGGIAQ